MGVNRVASTLYGLTNYYNMFKSPVSSIQMSPISNLLYGSIASSIYSQSIAKSAQSSISSYLTSLNGTVSNLKVSAKSLSIEAPTSTLNKKAVTSSDNTVISGTANWNADAKTYSITVSKLATGQTNKGAELKSGNASAFSQGLNTFTIKSNGITKTAAFTVSAGDTNKTALNKMASSINKANAGVTASVVSDEKTGNSYLKLDSSNTGTNNTFALTDTAGDAVAASGAGTVQKDAQNAEYVLDGKQYSSQSNTINLNNGKVQITLNKADNKEIKLTVGADTKGIEADINNFVNSYNSIINLSNQYSDQLSGAQKLGDEFKGIINSRKNTLANIGITINSDNTLKVDEAKLSKALNSNSSYVKDIFKGPDGIAGKVYSKSTEVMTAPLKYSQPDLLTSGYVNNLNLLLPGNQLSSTGNAGMNGLYSGLVLNMLL